MRRSTTTIAAPQNGSSRCIEQSKRLPLLYGAFKDCLRFVQLGKANRGGCVADGFAIDLSVETTRFRLSSDPGTRVCSAGACSLFAHKGPPASIFCPISFNRRVRKRQLP